jgi:tRNA threonylcarbamoyladenosine biosynthesis protein TsaE
MTHNLSEFFALGIGLMESLIINLAKPVDTRKFGRYIGRVLAPGDVLLMSGPLGAGKTTLTQGIAKGLGIESSVMSPTFVLMRELQGRLNLYHLDLYRLDNLSEVADLGLDDYFYGEGVTIVEWADRAADILPPEHLRVEIEYVDDNTRTLRLTACGERYQVLLTELEALRKGDG